MSCRTSSAMEQVAPPIGQEGLCTSTGWPWRRDTGGCCESLAVESISEPRLRQPHTTEIAERHVSKHRSRRVRLTEPSRRRAIAISQICVCIQPRYEPQRIALLITSGAWIVVAEVVVVKICFLVEVPIQLSRESPCHRRSAHDRERRQEPTSQRRGKQKIRRGEFQNAIVSNRVTKSLDPILVKYMQCE